jgi:hypothetical protein
MFEKNRIIITHLTTTSKRDVSSNNDNSKKDNEKSNEKLDKE